MIGNLLRFKGLLIATGVLLVLSFLYAIITTSMGQRELQFTTLIHEVSRLDLRVDQEPNTTFNTELLDQIISSKRLSPGSRSQNTAIQLLDSINAGNQSQSIQLFANLNSELAAEQTRKRKLSTYIHWAALFLFLVYYGFAIIPQILRLSQTEEVVVESRKEAEDILATVSEGLFLLKKDYEIGIEQSKSLKELFRSDKDLEGNFFDFIANYVPESSVTIARDYLDLLFGDRVKEKLIRDLNPLNEVCVNIARRDGSFESRYLNFKFNRVMEDGELSHVLGSVTDVTREVQLRNELESTKEEQEAQLDLLMQVLHLDQSSLTRFFERSDKTLKHINATLEARGHENDEIRRKIKTIKEQAHRIKGDAAALGLHGFEFNLHEFETALDTVQKMPERITGRDLLPAVTCLKSAFSELENMRRIVSRFSAALKAEQASDSSDLTLDKSNSQIGNQTPNLAEPTRSSIEAPLYSLVDELQSRRGVRVILNTFGLSDQEVPEDIKDVLSSASVQLIRNSIVHGALTPKERLAQGKPDYMTLTISLTKTDQGHSLLVRDDGEGLNEAKIIQRGAELGLVSAKIAENPPAGIAQRLIFQSGFSSQTEVDLDAGRGVGLNSVYTMVREAGGTVAMRHRQGGFCQFNLAFKR